MCSIYSIYKITNKINGKSYIGRTSRDPTTRWNEHLKESKIINNKRNKYLYNAINKYGQENFIFEVLYQTEDKINWLNNLETTYIDEHNTLYPNGYNLTLGGEGVPGLKWSPESKRKQSENAINRNRDINYRKKISKTVTENWKDPEFKSMMKEKFKKGWTKDVREEFSKTKKEYCNRPEIKERLSQMQKERCKNQDYLNKISKTLCKFTYEITFQDGSILVVESLRKFAKDNNLNSGSLYRVVNGYINHYKGITVKRIN